MKKWLKITLGSLVCLVIVYAVGPQPATPHYSLNLPIIHVNARDIDKYVAAQEALHKLKPDNQARVVWYNDSIKQPTEYAIVYLHGFGASWKEGDPTHKTIAKMFGCNLYLDRMAEHGIDTSEQLMNITPENYWASAKEALAIGKKLGKKVILMGTSTGGTQALQLAAAFPNDVAGLILYSPNIALKDSKAWVLNKPWGLQIARKVRGSNYYTPEDQRAIYKQYWYASYRLEALVTLEEILNTTMTDRTFMAIHQPTLALYYYKDEDHQDDLVSISAIKKMMSTLATPDTLKRLVDMPYVGNHVMGCSLKSNDVYGVISETTGFLVKVMGMRVEAKK
ncbi:alpha/beta hydrolase [Parasediminibacterium sp. JCM 36343]|uniref:alpha/beta hydrolase n=1 Tax=Parasediminibacterium sp. JCM 36343 TaxID=3374279 RepID=UPI00397E038D